MHLLFELFVTICKQSSRESQKPEIHYTVIISSFNSVYPYLEQFALYLNSSLKVKASLFFTCFFR